jgi:hypothetical protein
MTKPTVVIPHSWDMETWPASVWPGSAKRARYVVRAYRDQLHRHGALTRIGRTLVFLGAGYQKFLAANAARVHEFDIAPNRS